MSELQEILLSLQALMNTQTLTGRPMTTVMGLPVFSKEDGLKQLDHEPSRLKDQDQFSSLLLVLLILSGAITSKDPQDRSPEHWKPCAPDFLPGETSIEFRFIMTILCFY